MSDLEIDDIPYDDDDQYWDDDGDPSNEVFDDDFTANWSSKDWDNYFAAEDATWD